ncbi:MAG: arylsulfatase [Bryobacteraceae bacterium]|nr:arylsulfatase [Bryobacteraceae bacterium]
MTRRELLAAPAIAMAQAPRRPNVIVLISDDQGYGDLSIHGNPHLETPNLDSIARGGVQFTQFHSNPVCSPTRASLMTGRHYYRTGVTDTYIGRSMMRPDEVTMADVFRKSGYRTGIFGKWHLGDHYPLRPFDRGFDTAVTHFGGGIGQPSDPPGGERYYDPLLQRNGKPERFRGYCTDIFFDEALRFIETNRTRPFFTYIATNAPHTPLEIAEEFVEPFRNKNLDEVTSRIYGMVRNLDANVGKLLAHLQKLNLERDTILVFLTDNGPQQRRFNASMRGLKGSVYEGGIRVPCFVRWPARITPGTSDNRLAAHIDLLPTLARAAGVALPDRPLDGRDILGNEKSDRTICFQWHRGDAPEKWRNACARNQRWKLVENKELFDLEKDPAESTDVAAQNPQILEQLRRDYDAWFASVTEKGFDPVRIPIGTPHENPVMLSQQDWRGPRAVWGPEALGHWEVDVAQAGRYSASFLVNPGPACQLTFRLNGVERTVPVPAGLAEVRLASVDLPKGQGRLEAVLHLSGGPGEKTRGVRFASLEKI